MNCREIQEQLSAFHDGELASEMRAVVAAHVGGCEQCASQLAQYASLSSSFRQLSQPEVPTAVWAGIAAGLDQDTGGTTSAASLSADQPGGRWLTSSRLALAASVLLVLGLGLWMTRHPDHADHSDEFVMTMDHYLETLARDPDQAEQFLLNKYDGQTVKPEDAVRLVGYRPAVASGLPEGYTLASTSVMKMPCCTCVKAVCKRKDGTTLVLFEHDDEDTAWFGERASSMATCGDTECCLVDLDSSIAATWKRGSRWVTAVGVRDTAEVSALVTWLDGKTGLASQTFEES
jgi:hypothetical protein